ncbi:non-specific lipid transfer protein GPI-anchored 15-like [Andrographis paniculata]|uniref:non-specific lipid transfer protein GPI-anchored 15-like n=1 Tax=Andrographis paniculata TaxID=175694 RepID=UPI0021E98D52|nr:non-specific lipid transfer protein GPI-anchored 15-like [Andrographis paniculata]
MILSGSLAAASPESDNCQDTVSTLMPCYAFITGSGAPPAPQCCDRFRTVLSDRPRCLCQVLEQKGINTTRAMELPGACHVETPSVSKCHSPPAPAGPHGATPPPPGHSISTRISCCSSLILAIFAVIITVI